MQLHPQKTAADDLRGDTPCKTEKNLASPSGESVIIEKVKLWEILDKVSVMMSSSSNSNLLC